MKTSTRSRSNRKKLLDKLDKTWSLRVRERDKRCLLCGLKFDVKKLQAHHWVVSRGRSLRYRWDIRNGVSLCYACHIFKVHHNPTVETIDKLKENVLKCGKIITETEMDEIKQRCHEITKLNIVDLEELLNQLEGEDECTEREECSK